MPLVQMAYSVTIRMLDLAVHPLDSLVHLVILDKVSLKMNYSTSNLLFQHRNCVLVIQFGKWEITMHL
ncbi:hypothetical protein BN13_2110002 [Nostocoides jenkinsii Ben 74]|uniref:Uncharacterized protein n=1 Tax=Nostocoides jenkinsii Ben 74 TaxID=1193518 RepID=A0A077MAD4_9MICO|nr:hypothetical protein BN13_2110002 [Tetrasphaera jenkinsii Ben 74]